MLSLSLFWRFSCVLILFAVLGGTDALRGWLEGSRRVAGACVRNHVISTAFIGLLVKLFACLVSPLSSSMIPRACCMVFGVGL